MTWLTNVVTLAHFADSDRSKDNNFTIMRLLFATAVLFGHGYAIAGFKVDPVSGFVGVWIGQLAVNGFFVFSGFLVTASLQRTGTSSFGFVRFAALRIARIYPAAIVCISLSVVIGSIVSTLAFAEYFASPMTWTYAANATLLYLSWTLPGVFEGQAFGGSVNGSLWSIILEFRCYVYLLIAGFFGMLDTRLRANVAVVTAYVLLHWAKVPLIDSPAWILPCDYFLLGILLWINRDLVPVHWGLALISCVVLVSGVAPKSDAFTLAYSYLLFFIVYGLPRVKLGFDLSYGVYLYAWPVQQMVWTTGQSGLGNFALAAPLTFAAAALSWMLIEKPALNLVHRLTRRRPASITKPAYNPA